jgi:hypothetical protein
LSFRDGAAVAAGIAAHAVAVERFPERVVAFADALIHNVAQRGHDSIVRLGEEV